MQFVYPGFLFALTALSIPIIIHLFNFRRFKRIYFTNVRFLQEIKQDTKSRSRLKHLLVLISRLLAILFLVLAFAQPVIPLSKKQKAIASASNRVSIYIDNSFSMDAVGQNGSLVETAKKKATEIAMAYRPSDQFQLVTNDFEAKHQRFVNREELIRLVDEVQSSSSVKKLSDVVTRTGAQVASTNEQRSLYLVSDFQKTTANIDQLKADSSSEIQLVHLEAAQGKNVFIDTCFFASPLMQLNASNELTIKLRNGGSEDAENVPVKLLINGVQRAVASVNVPANGIVETKLVFTITQPGWQKAEVAITDYPVVFDDRYFFSFEVKEHLNILAINQTLPSSYITALFGSDPYFSLKNSPAGQVDYSSFGQNNLIILNGLQSISSGLTQELKKYLDNGGAVIMFPGDSPDLESYRQFAASLGVNAISGTAENDKVNSLESNHPLFSDVFEKGHRTENNLDLPVVTKYFVFTRSVRSNEEILMRLQSGNAFFSSNAVGQGILYQSAVPLDESFSNFPKHALFVPVILKTAMIGLHSAAPLVIGANEEFFVNNFQTVGENIFHLINRELSFEVIPETKMINSRPVISFHGQVKKAGNYTLQAGGKTISEISFNYDRRESNLACYSESELKGAAEKSGLHSVNVMSGNKPLTHQVAAISEGKKLWKYCVMLALLFMALEVVLIRFMK